MKAKSKILLTSFATIALSASLIGGSTFALFTSESGTNIAVTSGKVNVEATIQDGSLLTYSYVETSGAYAEVAEGWTDGHFELGGKAELTETGIKLDKMVPGDKATFNILLTNHSTVAVKYRTSIALDAESDAGLFKALEMEIGDEKLADNFSGTKTSAWMTDLATNDTKTLAVTVELPYAFEDKIINGDESASIQGKEVILDLMVEAVQGNANTVDVTVSNADDLTALAKAINEGNDYAGQTIVLTQDLAVSDWTPIGNGMRSGSGYSGAAFKGTFDGNGHTVTINSVAATDNEDAVNGLFGVIDGGMVSNLNVVADITASCEQVGAVAGLLANGGTIDNVTVSGKVSGTKGVGGIVGRILANGTITNSTNEATISGTGYNIGGIVGAAYYTNEGETMTISGCSNSGAVSGPYGVGGIVGLSAANVSNCVNTGVVTGNGSSVGGVVGEQQNYGSVAGCTNRANVTNASASTSAYGTGGVVGWVRYNGATTSYKQKGLISISGNTNYGSVYGVVDAGGIVGTVYNAAIVNGNTNYAEKLSATTFAAGIVGNVQCTENPDGISEFANHIEIRDNKTYTKDITASSTDTYFYSNGNAVEADNNTMLSDAEITAIRLARTRIGRFTTPEALLL